MRLCHSYDLSKVGLLTSRLSSTLVLIMLALVAFVIACSTRTHLPVDVHPTEPVNSAPTSETSAASTLPLKVLADIPLTGGTTRLDYQSLDSGSGRLYIAHLGSDLMTVFDVNKQTIVGDVKDLKRVHGVLAVPELHRVYASATGTNELAVIDDQNLTIVARVPAGDYPDGIAYASKENKIYVSDLHGKADTVIDAKTNQRITTIELGGGAGNSQYLPRVKRIRNWSFLISKARKRRPHSRSALIRTCWLLIADYIVSMFLPKAASSRSSTSVVRV